MGFRILGVGLGLFIVLLLWTIALIAYVLLWRSKGAVSYARISCLAFAVIVTVVLALIPRTKEPVAEETKIFDSYFIGRISLVVAMGIFALLSCILMILTRWSQPLYASPIKSH